MLKKRAFTLIEVLVAVFIFAIIFGIAIMAVNFSSGKVQSKKPLTLTREARNAMETISQKMNNANAKATVGGTVIYGFRVDGNELKIVTSIPGGAVQCSFIKQDGDYLKMAQNNCSVPTSTEYKNITSSDIIIRNFNIPDKYFMINSSPDKAPYVQIIIEARDAKSPDEPTNPTSNIKVQTSYEMDYQTIKNLK